MWARTVESDARIAVHLNRNDSARGDQVKSVLIYHIEVIIGGIALEASEAHASRPQQDRAAAARHEHKLGRLSTSRYGFAADMPDHKAFS